MSNHEQKKIRKGSSEAGQRTPAKRTRKNSVRDESQRNPGREVASTRDVSPLARLVQALRQEGIRFQIAGMSAAILHGVPATTIDTDIWVELPERQFVRLTQIIVRHGGVMLAPTVAALSDDSLVNFLPRVEGIGTFDEELRNADVLPWQGMKIPVLPLDRIIASKRFLQRTKDMAHLPLLEQTLSLKKKTTHSKSV